MNPILESALRGAPARAGVDRNELFGEARSIADALRVSCDAIDADRLALSFPVLSEEQADALGADPSFGNFALDLADLALASALDAPAALPAAAFVAGFCEGALLGDGGAGSVEPFSFSEREIPNSAVSRAAQIQFATLQARLGETFGESTSATLIDDHALWGVCQRAQSPFLARRPLTLCMALGFAQGVLSAQNRIDAIEALDRSLDRLHAAAGFVAPRAPARAQPPARQPAAQSDASLAASEASAEPLAAFEAATPALSAANDDAVATSPVEAVEELVAAEAPAFASAEPETRPVSEQTDTAQAPAEPAEAVNEETDAEAEADAGDESSRKDFDDEANDAKGLPAAAVAAISRPKPKREARPRGPTRPPKSTKPKAKPETGSADLSPQAMTLRLDDLRRDRKERERQKMNRPEATQTEAPANPSVSAAATAAATASAGFSASSPDTAEASAKKPARLPGRAAARARKAGARA